MACFITWTILFEKPSFKYLQKISVQCIRKPEVFWKRPVRKGSRKKPPYFEEHPRMAAPEFCFESFEIKIAGKSFSRFCSYLAFLSFCKICKTIFFCYITSNVNFLKAAAEKIIETLIFFRENLLYCNITVKI